MLAAVLALSWFYLVLEAALLADCLFGVLLDDFYLGAGFALDYDLILEVVLGGQVEGVVGVADDERQRWVLHIIIM